MHGRPCFGGGEEEPAAAEEEALDEERMLSERVSELEAAVLEAKRTALGLKRAGDTEGAKAALRAAKAHLAELDETKALLA